MKIYNNISTVLSLLISNTGMVTVTKMSKTPCIKQDVREPNGHYPIDSVDLPVCLKFGFCPIVIMI